METYNGNLVITEENIEQYQGLVLVNGCLTISEGIDIDMDDLEEVTDTVELKDCVTLRADKLKRAECVGLGEECDFIANSMENLESLILDGINPNVKIPNVKYLMYLSVSKDVEVVLSSILEIHELYMGAYSFLRACNLSEIDNMRLDNVRLETTKFSIVSKNKQGEYTN